MLRHRPSHEDRLGRAPERPLECPILAGDRVGHGLHGPLRHGLDSFAEHGGGDEDNIEEEAEGDGGDKTDEEGAVGRKKRMDEGGEVGRGGQRGEKGGGERGGGASRTVGVAVGLAAETAHAKATGLACGCATLSALPSSQEMRLWAEMGLLMPPASNRMAC